MCTNYASMCQKNDDIETLQNKGNFWDIKTLYILAPYISLYLNVSLSDTCTFIVFTFVFIFESINDSYILYRIWVRLLSVKRKKLLTTKTVQFHIVFLLPNNFGHIQKGQGIKSGY